MEQRGEKLACSYLDENEIEMSGILRVIYPHACRANHVCCFLGSDWGKWVRRRRQEEEKEEEDKGKYHLDLKNKEECHS